MSIEPSIEQIREGMGYKPIPDVSWEDMTVDDKLFLLYSSQARIENQLDELLEIGRKVGEAAGNFQESIPPGIKAMLGL